MTHGEYWSSFIVPLVGVLSLLSLYLMLGRPRRAWTHWLFLTVLLQLDWFSDFQGFFHQEQELELYWLMRSQVRLMWFSCLLLWTPKWASRWFLILVVVQMACRILVPLQSPHPDIDVYVIGTQGADRLLRGVNPYVGEYPEAYQPKYGYRAIYLYWPTGLLLESAFRGLTGDIRYSLVAAELGTVVLLYLWLPGHPMRRWLWILAWLTLPTQLVVLEKAWIEPIQIFFYLLPLWFIQCNRPWWAGLSLGLLCGVKQTAIFLPLLLLPYFGRKFGRSATLRAVAACLVGFLLVVLPFAVADWSWFYASTIEALLKLPPRYDSLNLTSHLHHLGLPFLNGPGYGLVLLVSLVGLLSWLRGQPELSRTLAATFAFYCLLFLCGKQAFLNYYVFLVFLLLVTLAESERSLVQQERTPVETRPS